MGAGSCLETTRKDGPEISKEFIDKIKELAEAYRPNIITAKYISDVFKSKLESPPDKVVISDQIEPGTIHIMTNSEAIAEFKVRKDAFFELPACVDIKFIPLKKDSTEKEIELQIIKRRKAGAEIHYNTEIDLGYGATCTKCKKHSEYAEASSEFVCWSCKNGY